MRVSCTGARFGYFAVPAAESFMCEEKTNFSVFRASLCQNKNNGEKAIDNRTVFVYNVFCEKMIPLEYLFQRSFLLY